MQGETNSQEDQIRRIIRDETQSKGEAPAAAPIADPAPLGLGAFALTTFVLSCVNAGFFGVTTVAVPLAFFYGGLAQFLAGIWEFRNQNTFGATAFSSYGMFWVALGFLIFFEEQLGLTEQTIGAALGITLLGWTIFTAYMFVGALNINRALITVFGLLFITFALLTLGEFFDGAWGTIGGYFGLATAAAAWYTSAAGVINSTAGKTVLPTG